jgi:tight adherence protein B
LALAAALLAGTAVLLLLWPSRRTSLAEVVRGSAGHRPRRPPPLRPPRADPFAIALAQAGISLSPLRFRLVCIAASLPLALLLLLLGIAPAAAAAGPVLSLALGHFLVHFLARRSRARMESALVGALPPLVASLRAGMGLELAIAQLASRVEPPLREELEAVLAQVRLGAPVQQALDDLARRWPLPAVRTLAVAIGLQREVGGSLANVLEIAEEGIRARHELLGELRSLTAQQRLTAYILLGLPFACLAAISMFSPDYASRLFGTLSGRLLFGGAVALQAFGYLAMRSLMRVDIDVG